MTRCPLDGSELVPGTQLLRDNRFALPYKVTVDWCPSCGLGVTQGAPTGDELSKLYETCYVDESDQEPQVPRTSRIASLWRKLNGSIPLVDADLTSPILDVGSNTGDQLLAQHLRGLDVVGLEPNPVAAARARQRGLEIIEAPIEHAQLPPLRFRTVLLSQVLEHVEQPSLVLNHVRPTLAPNGRIFVVVPNARSVFRSIFGVDWVHWHVPFHLWHHTQRSLTLLLESAGFRVRHMRSISPGEWLLMSIEARQNARRGVYRLEPFTGRFAARAALAPFGRSADFFGRGDGLYAVAGPD